MKFSQASLLFAVACISGATAFAPAQNKAFVAQSNTALFSATEDVTEKKKPVTKKNQRLKFMKNPQFFRNGFKEVREEVKQNMEESFESSIVQELKTNDFLLERDGVRVHLAKDYGFCWGVERSIALAYEAASHYGDKTVHITNELIHNPKVNDDLGDMGVKFIEKNEDGTKDFATIEDGDVVILPAFGASFEEMQLFDEKNVDVVDTTCPWVSKVWNTVDMHQKKGLTSIIHGKYAHEETVATVSFCEDYVCVKDLKETEMVTDYITKGGDKEAFLEYFKNAISVGFDPDTMLNKVGLANQTTMYKKETRAVGQLIQKAMMAKFGPAEVNDHYVEFDTICDATQERQDAISELVENTEKLGLDFILVIGGWDSSNTAHLLEIPQKAGVRSFHIDRPECIGADNTITHRLMNGETKTEPFIVDLSKDLVMGVTSGASTPDKGVQDSLDNIFMLKKVSNKEE